MNNKSSIDMKNKERLKKEISNLQYSEHCEIFNIIRKDTDKISENKNGVFINLKYVKDETLIKVQEFIDFCKKNNNLLKKKQLAHDNELKTVNKSIKNNSENDLHNELENDLQNDYDVYSLGKESMENIDFPEEIKEDKFTFQNYINKLSISSNKNFKDSETAPKKKKIVIKQSKKLSGVNARLLKKCRNLNKHNSFIKNNKNVIIENLLEDSLANYNTYDYDTDLINLDQLSKDI